MKEEDLVEVYRVASRRDIKDFEVVAQLFEKLIPLLDWRRLVLGELLPLKIPFANIRSRM
jgi:hypothetical protein